MADILIRGMEMPESCDKCNLFNGCWCMALGIGNWRKSYNKPPEGERLSDCPLDPLPEGHGRLIDAEAYVDYMQNRYDNNEITNGDWIDFRLSLKEQPTIVPAEGGQTNGETD